MKSNSVYFVYGNHGNSPHQLDDLWSICSALVKTSTGHTLRASEHPVANATNLLVECFDRDFTSLVADVKSKYPETRLHCIVTEFVTDGTFNNFQKIRLKRESVSFGKRVRNLLGRTIAHMFNQELRDHLNQRFGPAYRLFRNAYFSTFGKDAHKRVQTHYEQLQYWQNRFDNFSILTRSFDTILTVTDHQLPEYNSAFPKTQVLSLPVFPVSLPQIYEHDSQDIDYFFSGTLTEHRKKVIETLRALGMKVVTAPANLPESIRTNYLSRSKVCLHIKLRPDWPYPSNLRLHQLLTYGKTIVTEASQCSCWQEQFCITATPENFIQTCLAAHSSLKSSKETQRLYKDQSANVSMTAIKQFSCLLQGSILAGIERSKDQIKPEELR
jgi:hypothetical protein